MAVCSISTSALICLLILGFASILNAIVCNKDDDYAKIISEHKRVATYFTGFTHLAYAAHVDFFMDLGHGFDYAIFFVLAETENLGLGETIEKYEIPVQSLPVVTFIRNGTVVDRFSGLVDAVILDKVVNFAYDDQGDYDE